MHEQHGRIEFTNHLMFNAVLTENEDLCKHLIGAVLGKHVEHIEYLVDDGATTILLNAQAWEQEENPEVSGMLQYALTGRSSGNLAKNLADAVDGKNLDRKWVRATMGVMSYEHEFRVLNSTLEEKRAEIARVRTEIEQKHAELAQAQSELEQSNSELAQAQSKLEQSNSELAQSRSELEHSMSELAQSRSELEHSMSELAQSQSELEQSQSELSSVQAQLALSKQLYADGRIDEYFEALDNPELMKALLDEYAG